MGTGSGRDVPVPARNETGSGTRRACPLCQMGTGSGDTCLSPSCQNGLAGARDVPVPALLPGNLAALGRRDDSLAVASTEWNSGRLSSEY